MRPVFPRLIRLFLATALVFGSVVTHAGSVVHAASNDSGIAHEHVSHTEAMPDLVDLADSNTSDPSHALGFCLDAHCCTPAVHMTAPDVPRRAPESGQRIIGNPSNYALSLAHCILKPPRAIA